MSETPLGRGSRQRANLSADVAELIRERIFDGRLTGGARIMQDDIAEELGVSRLPVREALISLQVDGLIDNEPRRGAFVVPLEREDIEDHYAMYGNMLGLAARRACGRFDEAGLRRLEDLIDVMGRDPDAPSTHEAHWEFHSTINQVGGSHRLKAVLRQMAHNLPRSVYDIPPAGNPEAERGHRAIVAALRQCDRDVVAAECQAHLQIDGAAVIVELARRGLLA
ncbi:MAG: GntR family transcriptional regulator [Mycobacterium sp.]